MRCDSRNYLVLLVVLSLAAPSLAEDVTLIKNDRMFDGASDQLSEPRNVLVRGNKIEKISATDIPTDSSADT